MAGKVLSLGCKYLPLGFTVLFTIPLRPCASQVNLADLGMGMEIEDGDSIYAYCSRVSEIGGEAEK